MSAHHPDDGDFFDEQVSKAVRDIVERRALIEQTKGMLSFVYGITADEAFEVLRRQSQDHNIKLHLIAEQIRKDLLELSGSQPFERRVAFDSLLLTAHRRVAHVAERLLDGQSKISRSGG